MMKTAPYYITFSALVILLFAATQVFASEISGRLSTGVVTSSSDGTLSASVIGGVSTSGGSGSGGSSSSSGGGGGSFASLGNSSGNLALLTPGAPFAGGGTIIYPDLSYYSSSGSGYRSPFLTEAPPTDVTPDAPLTGGLDMTTAAAANSSSWNLWWLLALAVLILAILASAGYAISRKMERK